MDISGATRVGRKFLKLKYCGAVIVAAGTASRMGGIDKVMAPLGGEPMVVKAVRAFAQCDAVHEIVVVTRPDLIVPVMDLASPPYGVDLVAAQCLGVRAWRESGVPGRYCPLAAARAMADAIDRHWD